MPTKSIKQVQREIEANDPPIEVNQVWYMGSKRAPTRRIRILARYPEPLPYADDKQRVWLYANLPGGSMRLRSHELGAFPEFNLRYVARLEGEYTG